MATGVGKPPLPALLPVPALPLFPPDASAKMFAKAGLTGVVDTTTDGLAKLVGVVPVVPMGILDKSGSITGATLFI